VGLYFQRIISHSWRDEHKHLHEGEETDVCEADVFWTDWRNGKSWTFCDDDDDGVALAVQKHSHDQIFSVWEEEILNVGEFAFHGYCWEERLFCIGCVYWELHGFLGILQSQGAPKEHLQWWSILPKLSKALDGNRSPRNPVAGTQLWVHSLTEVLGRKKKMDSFNFRIFQTFTIYKWAKIVELKFLQDLQALH